MTIRLGVVMDPIASIHYKKDSTLAMLWEATSAWLGNLLFRAKRFIFA